MIATRREVIALYREIPKEAHEYIAHQMGWLNERMVPIVFQAPISLFRMRLIKYHLKNYRSDIAFSRIGKPGEYDPEQHRMYFKSLTDLINGPEYKFMKEKQRSAIIEEHKKIGKQIQLT